MEIQEFSFDLGVLGQEQKTEPETTYDLLILGGGPAAMTAAVYAARKMIKVAMITKDFGGQMGSTSEIENYMGFQMITGRELVEKFVDQVRHFEVPVLQGEKVAEVQKENDLFRVLLEGGTVFSSRAVIMATGKRDRPLNVPGEKELVGRGVAYCSTCDAPFFKDKQVVVAGGGNSAFTAALDLLKLAGKVTLVNFVAGWQADEIMTQAVTKYEHARLLDHHQVTRIEGTERVTSVHVKDRESGAETVIPAEGIFVEIGLLPNSESVAKLAKLNEARELVVDCHSRTSVENLLGAGDVTTVPQKQIIISAGEGAKAALSAYEYLTKKGWL